MSERVFYPDTNDVQARAKLLRSASLVNERVNDLPIHAFFSRHSFSTRRSLVRRLVSVGGSLIRTADQARGKVGGAASRDRTREMIVPLVYTLTTIVVSFQPIIW
jgi:hypothetical protein